MDIERVLASLTDSRVNSDGWLRINEFSDLMSSLRTLEKLLELTSQDIGTWKWVVLCLHNSLQATAVCLLTRSDGFGARKDHVEQKIYNFYKENKNTIENSDEFDTIAAKLEVAPLPVLLRRLGYNFPKDDPPPSKEIDMRMHYLVMLHNWRSLFSHFPPLHWSAPEREFVELAKVVISTIRNELTSEKWKRPPLITEDELLPLLDAIEGKLS